MIPIALLVVFSVIVASATAQNVTSPTQDYFLLSQRQMRSDIYLSELQIDSMDARGVDSIKYISEQHRVLLQEIQRVDDALLPLQALSPIRKRCVQKYRPLFIRSGAAQWSLASCRSSAQSRVNYMTANAKTSLNYAKMAADTNLPKAIATCNNTLSNQAMKLEECVLTNVETFSKIVQTNLNGVDKYLKISHGTLSELTGDAIRCSFVIEQNTLVTIGTTLDLIDYCIKETHSLCPCGSQNNTAFRRDASIQRIIVGV